MATAPSLLGLPLGVLALLVLALGLGALVQGTVGLGLGLVAAPVMTLLAPELVPGVMLWLTLLLPLATLAGGRRAIDWRGLAWSLPARVPGTVLGAWLVVVLDPATLGLAIGAVVLAAVVLTATTVRLPLRRESLLLAGLVSGVSGTVSSIGGPPMALLYQHRPLAEVRQTLAVYFFVGATLSLLALVVGGEVGWGELGVAAVLSPAVVVGYALSPLLRRRVRAGQVRAVVLVVCATSATVLLVRSLLSLW